MKRRHRLRRRRDFQAVLAGARVYAGATLVAFAARRPAPPTRVGVTVSRQVRGAVLRNRAKRRLREAARLRLLGEDSPLRELGRSYDVVLIARPAALEAEFGDLLRDVDRCVSRLRRSAAVGWVPG